MTTTPAPLNSDDKLWIIFCHLSIFLGVGLLGPLIVYLVKKKDEPITAEYAKEALNFHISVVIYIFASILLMLLAVGFVLIFIVPIWAAVLSIIAAIKTSNGEFYRYPLTLRLVK